MEVLAIKLYANGRKKVWLRLFVCVILWEEVILLPAFLLQMLGNIFYIIFG